MKTEAELAARTVEYLEASGYEVRQEVQLHGKVCDIVALAGPLMWAIECKLSLNLEVIGQAHYWLQYAHRVSIAVPLITDNAKYRGANVVLHRLGIGCIFAWRDSDVIEERWAGTFNRRPLPGLRKVLAKHQNLAPAGTNRGGYYTPFKDTCQQLRRLATDNPGLHLGDALKRVDHHYSSHASGRAALSRLILNGDVPGLRLEQNGKFLALYASVAVESGEKEEN